MLEFLNYIYDKSIKLKEGFLITESIPWNELTVLNEMNVQIAHVYNIDTSSIFNEPYRNITNLGDEVSDVFFQLICLLFYGKYKLEEIKYNTDSKSLDDFIVVLGQLNEVLLESHGHRFNKPRLGYDNNRDYILDRISNLFSIIYNYSKEKDLDIYKEYDLMVEDATAFLKRYKKEK